MSVFIVNIWSLLLMKQIAELFGNMLSIYFYLYFYILFIWMGRIKKAGLLVP